MTQEDGETSKEAARMAQGREGSEGFDCRTEDGRTDEGTWKVEETGPGSHMEESTEGQMPRFGAGCVEHGSH
jgi:hypothetical protein